ncbi:MAG: MFS transporter [Candidatus Heimdallarchaeota archaeon]|nr:MAG: MFS transporter [Candidatus Heimdallarchaeota archaeon]
MENTFEELNESTYYNLRGYIAIWIGQSVSLLGSSIVQFAIIWWLTLETGSAFVLSLATFCGLVPMVLLGPFSGVLADRWNRKKIILTTDFLQAIATIGLIGLFWLDIVEIWHVLTLLTVRGVFQAFQMPAIVAIVPQMVPKNRISRINALNSIFNNIIFIIGPAVAAIFLVYFSVGTILWLDAISFLAAVATLVFVAIPPVIKTVGTELENVSFRAQFFEGMSYLRASGFMPLIIGFTIANILINPIFSLFPLFIKELHSGGVWELAIVISIFQAGNFTGSLLIAVKNYTPKISTIMFVTIITFTGMLIIAAAPVGFFLIIGIGALITGFSVGIIDVGIISILQIHIPSELQGRIMSVIFTTIKSILPIALLFVGSIAEVIGLAQLYLICPIIGLLMVAYFVLVVKVQQLDLRLQADTIPVGS